MDGFVKWLGKTSLSAVAWVFILSLSWNERTLFSYANETLIQNQIVRTIDSTIAEMWKKMSTTAKSTMDGDKKREKI